MQTEKIAVSLEKYISEPKRKPRLKEATRQLTEQQIQKFLKCRDCQNNPALYIRVGKGKKRRDVGVCAADWVRIADTVLGWKGE